MSRITRFAARDPGPAARMTGFVAHRRDNGLRLGVGETQTALAALTHVTACDPDEACLALKAVCVGNADEAARFDDLFDSYWRADGRVRRKAVPRECKTDKNSTNSRDPQGDDAGARHHP